jgi:hypothetical protein
MTSAWATASSGSASSGSIRTRLDAHPAGEQHLAELDDAGLALVRGHQVGQHGPARHQLKPASRVRLDTGRGGQRKGNARAGGPHGAQSGRARVGGQRLPASGIDRMQVQRSGARVYRAAGLAGQFLRGCRHGRVLAATVQRGLQQYLTWLVRHGHQLRASRPRSPSRF